MAPIKTEQVMVRLTPDVYAQLKGKADSEERRLAQEVRLAIRNCLGANANR